VYHKNKKTEKSLLVAVYKYHVSNAFVPHDAIGVVNSTSYKWFEIMTDRISIYSADGELENTFANLTIRNAILLDANFLYTL
jgi:hypothetical protein